LLPELSRALDGAVFPLERRELVQVAMENEAPGTLVTLLGGVGEALYLNVEAVGRALAEAPTAG
jgi:hypothetical protein